MVSLLGPAMGGTEVCGEVTLRGVRQNFGVWLAWRIPAGLVQECEYSVSKCEISGEFSDKNLSWFTN